MKIGIVGAGAMGCIIGSFLARAREDVWLVDVWEEHVSSINQDGLTVMHEGKTDTVSIRATTSTKDVGICDVLIIFTKYHDTMAATQNALCMIDRNTIVMTVQNGIGNVEIISELVNKEQIVFGSTLVGSLIKGPGKIEASAADQKGATYIWPLLGKPSEKLKTMVDIFNQAGLEFILSPDVYERIWKKLCLNASVSMIHAITRLKTCDFLNQDLHSELTNSYLELIRNLILEIVAVANKEGVVLDPEEQYARIVNISKGNPRHLPSALADVLKERKTEIDSLNGAIIAKAKVHGMAVPYNTAIFHIMKIVENTYFD